MTPDRDRDYEESQKELKNAYQYLEIFSLTWTIDLLVNDPASEENSIALNLLRDRLIALEKEARAQTQQEGQGETSKWRSKGRFLPQFCDFIPQFSIYSTGNPIQDPYFLDFTLGFTYFLGFYPFTLYPLPLPRSHTRRSKRRNPPLTAIRRRGWICARQDTRSMHVGSNRQEL